MHSPVGAAPSFGVGDVGLIGSPHGVRPQGRTAACSTRRTSESKRPSCRTNDRRRGPKRRRRACRRGNRGSPPAPANSMHTSHIFEPRAMPRPMSRRAPRTTSACACPRRTPAKKRAAVGREACATTRPPWRMPRPDHRGWAPPGGSPTRKTLPAPPWPARRTRAGSILHRERLRPREAERRRRVRRRAEKRSARSFWLARRRGWVGEAGFEPTTTSTQSSCTTRLCDSPRELQS